MKIANLKYSFLLSAAALALSASVASAQPPVPTAPSVCSDSRNKTAWTAGKTAGDSRVTAVWKSAAIGQNLDNLSDKLPGLVTALNQTMVSLVGGQDVTDYVRCRAQGYVDGFFYRLNVLFGQCVLDGADWGQFAANLYCELSLDLGGLSDTSLFIRAPVGLCGNLFETACEDVYRYVGLEGNYSIQPTVAAFLQSSGFEPDPFPGCAEYAQDAFLDAFTSSLHNDCTYAVQ